MMAKAAADFLAGRDITVVRSSPLERALETAEPIGAELGLPVEVDDRLIEPWNHFEGMRFAVGDGALRRPRHWMHLWNPFRPSWGEPYRAGGGPGTGGGRRRSPGSERARGRLRQPSAAHLGGPALGRGPRPYGTTRGAGSARSAASRA